MFILPIYTGSNDTILSNEAEHISLYSGKKFASWEECENFITEWAKQQGFRVIKDCVTRSVGVGHYQKIAQR